MNNRHQTTKHEFTTPYIKKASHEVLQDMYQKIHNFLGNQKYDYRKSNKLRSEYTIEQVFLKDVLKTLLYRVQARKKRFIYAQHAKGKITHITSDMLKYTGTDALREILLLIPKIKKHPEVLQKRMTNHLSYEEKKQQLALVPKYIRCVVGTKKLLETILLGGDKIFDTTRQNEVQLELFPQPISEHIVTHHNTIVGSNDKPTQSQQNGQPIKNSTIGLTPEAVEDLYNDAGWEPEYKWQVFNNR